MLETDGLQNGGGLIYGPVRYRQALVEEFKDKSKAGKSCEVRPYKAQ